MDSSISYIEKKVHLNIDLKEFNVISLIEESGPVKVEIIQNIFSQKKYALKTISIESRRSDRARLVEIKPLYASYLRKIAGVISSNSVEIIDIIESPEDVKIIMPLATGNLISFLKVYSGCADNTISINYMVRSIFYSMIQILNQLRKKEKLIYLNLKPQNILVYGDGSKPEDFKLCTSDLGFGFYGQIKGDFSHKTTNYTAPEIRENPGINIVEHTKRLIKADIFSLGCIILDVYLSKYKPELVFKPFPKKDDLTAIIQTISSYVPPLFVKNFYSMLTWDYEIRMSLELGYSIIQLSQVITKADN
jgi:serine/threonine protein kinase